MSSVATCITHHGELLQGALRVDGCPTPCLVSLPRKDRLAKCRLELFAARTLEVVPAWKEKSRRAAVIVFERYRSGRATGRLTYLSAVAPGLGLGSSTADVVAAIRAAAGVIGIRLRPDEVAEIAVEAERAVDPLMFDRRTLLFAHRSGRALEDWGRWFPSFAVFSCGLAEPDVRVDTLKLPPPAYSEDELDRFAAIIATARDGFSRRDAAAIAAAATQSAVMNQLRVPMRLFSTLCDLAEKTGALGVQVAHSGVLGGILFEAEDPRLENRLATLAEDWKRQTGRASETFRTSADPTPTP